MDFRLDLEQTMLRDGGRRFVAENLGLESRAGEGRAPADHWSQLADLGWLLLPVPEEYDGLGGSVDDISIIAEELGRGLALEPFVEACVLPARLIELTGSHDQRQSLLPALASGAPRMAVGLYEPRRGFALIPTTTIATAEDDGFRLSGAKVGLDGGRLADLLIVSAELDGRSALFIVDAHGRGVERQDYDAIDGRWLSDFSFTDVALKASDRLSADTDIDAAIAQATDLALVAQCAEAVGCMDRAIELTADYLKLRRQFGQPLAQFQSLQHGMANMFIEADGARSILYGAMSLADAPAAERLAAVSACKVKVMEAARSVIGAAIHYHGGIGVTIEYSVGHYLLRALMLDQRFGNGAYHFERLVGHST